MTSDDLDVVDVLGADPRVMTSLGGVLTAEKSAAWLARQLTHWSEHGFGRYAVEREGVVVGFVGLSRTDFDAGFLPAVEVAWRLVFEHWGKGYATEAARAVLRDGFGRLGLNEIIGVTTPGNGRSRRVMDRLGMVHTPGDTFDDPRVREGAPLRLHVVYRLLRTGRL